MMVGAFIVRVPAPGWKPAGYDAAGDSAGRDHPATTSIVYDALKTPQFWLIWWVLCLNVTAGIGVLGQASAMSQEMFPGQASPPVAAAGFVGLLSLFNMGGRFFWASHVGLYRPQEHLLLLHRARLPAVLRRALYRLDRQRGRSSCCCFLVIISMYGGGFATVPAYLRDMFGTRYVGAIHGLLLTAWSMAGIFGPVLVNYIREYNITHGVPKAQAYNVHDVHHGRAAGDRLHLQLPDQGGASSLPHETRPRSRTGELEVGAAGEPAGA